MKIIETSARLRLEHRPMLVGGFFACLGALLAAVGVLIAAHDGIAAPALGMLIPGVLLTAAGVASVALTRTDYLEIDLTAGKVRLSVYEPGQVHLREEVEVQLSNVDAFEHVEVGDGRSTLRTLVVLVVGGTAFFALPCYQRPEDAMDQVVHRLALFHQRRPKRRAAPVAKP